MTTNFVSVQVLANGAWIDATMCSENLPSGKQANYSIILGEDDGSIQFLDAVKMPERFGTKTINEQWERDDDGSFSMRCKGE